MRELGYEARIRSLELSVGASVEAMRAFYAGVLGFREVGASKDLIEFEAGASRLRFVCDRPGAWHHFAMNIPEDALLSCRAWLLERTSLTAPRPDDARDPSMPEDVVHFAHWDAHALFFEDPAGNLVEFIARHELASRAGAEAFDVGLVECVSEIGLVAEDVFEAAREVMEATGLGAYREVSALFHPTGDARGLLIVFKAGRPVGVGERRRSMETHALRVGVRGARRGCALAGGVIVVEEA